MSWPAACGSEVLNPHCLETRPTDPNSWVFIPDLSAGPYNAAQGSTNKWVFAPLPVFYPSGNVPRYSAVNFNGEIMYCIYSTLNEICKLSDLPKQSGTSSGWEFVRNLALAGPSLYTKAECKITGTDATGYSNKPNAQSGACEKSPDKGPGAECVNPCVRMANGNLAVNKFTQECRVFPTTTNGGDASLGSLGLQCPTVCPSACVELWESCPAGTGPLATIAQNKSIDDLMSLTGPFKLDGTANLLWPSNYSNYANSTPAEGPIIGKPYTECYTYNTAFCDLPMAWQETVDNVTKCFSGCFPGTFADPANPKTCLFVPTSGIYDSATYSKDTPVQKVFCNPQYFNPVYWDNAQGLQKGCQALPLPSKQGSTCPQGTSAIVNEFFNVEWCMPDCPDDYFFDLSQNTCVAGCNSIVNGPEYKKYLDFIDIYANSGRCKDTTSVDADGLPKPYECLQDQTMGHCPSIRSRPRDSSAFDFDQQLQPGNVPIKFSSMNKQCSVKRAKDPAYTSTHNTYQTFLSSVKDYQASRKSNSSLGECPAGMVFGDTNCEENSGFCYDECNEGYEPVVVCLSGGSNCADKVYACRALCPDTREGLGPWTEVEIGGQGPIFTCAYNYPNGVPSDPNLWVNCPDDGRYTTLSSFSTDVAVTLSQAESREPLCIRNTYLRRQTCPLGFNEITDDSNGSNGQRCIQACDASEVLVTLPSGEIACQSSPMETSANHEFDIIAMADSENAKPQFRHRVIRRKSFARGIGIDPNTSTAPTNTAPVFITIGAVIVVAIIVLFLFKKK